MYESNRKKYITKGTTYYPVYDIFNKNVRSPIFDLGDRVTLEVLDTGLYLPTDTIMNSGYNHNDSSVVACVLTYGKNKFFFAGDLEAKGERNPIGKYPNYFTDYHVSMKASNHGSETSSNKEFLEYIKPENIFISAAVIEEKHDIIRCQGAATPLRFHTEKVQPIHFFHLLEWNNGNYQRLFRLREHCLCPWRRCHKKLLLQWHQDDL